MPGTSQKKTQRARRKKQTKKVKAASTVNVVVKTHAVAVNSKTKTGVKRAPRRKPAAAPAAPTQPLVLYASVFNTSHTPVTVRQPIYDFPGQYEPVKAPAVDVINIPTPSITARPTMVSTATETEPISPEMSDVGIQIKPQMRSVEWQTIDERRMLIDFAKQNGIPIKTRMSTTAMAKKLGKYGFTL